MGSKQKNGLIKRLPYMAGASLMLVTLLMSWFSVLLPGKASADDKGFSYTDNKYSAIKGTLVSGDGPVTFNKKNGTHYDAGYPSHVGCHATIDTDKLGSSDGTLKLSSCTGGNDSSRSVHIAKNQTYVATWIDHNHMKVFPLQNPSDSAIYFDDQTDNNDSYVAQGQGNGCSSNVVENFPGKGGDPANAGAADKATVTINAPVSSVNTNCVATTYTIGQFQQTQNYAKYFTWVDSGTIATTDGKMSFGAASSGTYVDSSGSSCKSQIKPDKSNPGHGTLIIRYSGSNPFGEGYSPQITGANFSDHSGCKVSKPLTVNIANPGGNANQKPPGTGTGPGGGSGGGAGSSGPACEYSANALSWIICPVVDLLTSAIEVTDSIITQQLVIPQQDIFCTNNNTCNDYYTAWASFRNISLGLLAIAGLITVIAQAVGMEILDAYTIRKILPRILIAAIGITLSWTLMNFAVTLANNLGFGVRPHTSTFP